MKKNYFLSVVMAVALCITLVIISCDKNDNEQKEDLSKYKESYYSAFQYMEKDNGVVRYWLGLSTAKLDTASMEYFSEGNIINFILNSEAPQNTEVVRPAAGTYILSNDQKGFTIDSRNTTCASVIKEGSKFVHSQAGLEDFTEAVVEVEHEGTTGFKILAEFKTRSGKSICVRTKEFGRVTLGSNVGDVEMNLIVPEAGGFFFGDYYGKSTGVWQISINDTGDAYTEGLYVDLTVASPTSTTFPTGTFKMSLASNVGTFFPGAIGRDNVAYYNTCWVRKVPKAAVAITGGTITITQLPDNNYTIAADVWDMFGNRLTGSWTGPLIFFDERKKTQVYTKDAQIDKEERNKSNRFFSPTKISHPYRYIQQMP